MVCYVDVLTIFLISVDFAGIMWLPASCLLSTTALTALYVLLAGSRLLYTVLIPANYSGESPGRVQAIKLIKIFYITSHQFI